MAEPWEYANEWEREHLERRLGRNDLPALLDEWERAGKLDDLDLLAFAVEEAWTMADFPTQRLARARWVELFERVGFLVDTKRDESARPVEPLTLYRAATAHDARVPGLAWTPDFDRARWFAEYNAVRWPGPFLLYRATVTPDRLLARFHETRHEDEYIVDVESGAATRME